MTQPIDVDLYPQSLAAYRELLGPAFDPVLDVSTASRDTLSGRVIWNVNSTARGGGVAEMLYAYLPYVLDAGVDTRWQVLQVDDPDFFILTKRIHNQLHGDPGDGGPLGPEERDFYMQCLADSAAAFAAQLSPDDVVILHDPQTAGLIPAAKETGATVVWRCHIGIDDANEITLAAQELLSELVEAADGCVFSRHEYVWPALDSNRVTVIPPGIDAFTPKNQHMDDSTLAAVLGQIGLSGEKPETPPVFTRSDCSSGTVTREARIVQEAPLPEDAPLVVQVSRWDKLKDHGGLLTLFTRDLKDRKSHLALVGPDSSGVDDDPEGAAVYQEIVSQFNDLPEEMRRRIHLVSLPMDDLEENAFMVNAIQRRATVIVQKSLAEGYGLTVSEGMWKSRPMVASRIGGIRDQIEDGRSGILIDDARDLPAFAAAIDRLLADGDEAQRIGDAAHEAVKSGSLSVQRLVHHYELLVGLS
jgi:trehalose synthase